MTRGPEGTLQDRCKRHAAKYGWMMKKVAFLNSNGANDGLFGCDGRAVWMEFKREGEMPTRQQCKRHHELRVVFGFRDVHWCDNFNDFCRIMGIPTT